jgi:DNA-binding response OmpR family regulator
MTVKDMRVLVADDDEILRDLMVRRLMRMGVKPDTAEDGRSALVMIERNEYDLIVTDIYMPGTTGLALLERAKAHDAHVQVVVVTAGATLENAVEALNKGAFGYLNKPFDHISVFENVASRALEFRRLVLDNARMAEAQRRRGDMLEAEITDRVLQLRSRQMELLDLLGALPEGVVVVNEDGRTPITSPAAERWLARELRSQQQPIQRFIETVHSVDGDLEETVSLDSYQLLLRAVEIPAKNEKRRKVVTIRELESGDGWTDGRALDVVAALKNDLAWIYQREIGLDVSRRLATIAQRLTELETVLGPDPNGESVESAGMPRARLAERAEPPLVDVDSRIFAEATTESSGEPEDRPSGAEAVASDQPDRATTPAWPPPRPSKDG